MYDNFETYSSFQSSNTFFMKVFYFSIQVGDIYRTVAKLYSKLKCDQICFIDIIHSFYTYWLCYLILLFTWYTLLN